jgi:hypothetical protein
VEDAQVSAVLGHPPLRIREHDRSVPADDLIGGREAVAVSG